MDDKVELINRIKNLVKAIDVFHSKKEECNLLGRLINQGKIKPYNNDNRAVITLSKYTESSLQYEPLLSHKISLNNLLNTLENPKLSDAQLKKIIKNYSDLEKEVNIVFLSLENENFVSESNRIKKEQEDRKVVSTIITNIENLRKEFVFLSNISNNLIDNDELLDQCEAEIESIDHTLKYISLFSRADLELLHDRYHKRENELNLKVNKAQQLKKELDESREAVSRFDSEFNQWQVYSQKIQSPEIPVLPSISLITHSFEDEIKLNQSHVVDNQASLQKMQNNVQNYIQNKISELLTFSQALSNSSKLYLNEKLEHFNSKPLSEQFEILFNIESDLTKRDKEAWDLASGFTNYISSHENGRENLVNIQLLLKKHIDDCPNLKEFMRQEMNSIPNGFLYCIKDMALWNPPPAAEHWQQIITAYNAYQKEESWAVQSEALYSAIYNYQYTPHEGKTSAENYQLFKQNSCMKIFNKEPLNEKKDYIEIKAEEFLPNRNYFLHWLNETIKQIIQMCNASYKNSFFKTKTQRELKVDIDKIIDNDGPTDGASTNDPSASYTPK